MTRKQIGGACGAILLAVITPLVVLALLHAFDAETEAAPAAQDYYQDPTFSIARGSASPFDPADALTLSPGPAPPPVVARTCAQFGLLFCGGGDDINSGSLGDDFKLAPPDPANASAYLYFSVAPGSTGFPGTGVFNETVGVGCIPEPEADEFGSAAGGSNYQFLDGDGVASCSNPAAPSLGLFEPNAPPGWPDDLDAVDPQTLAGVGFPIYGTADAASGTLGVMPPPWNSPAAIHVDNGAGFVIPGYATPAALGLAAGDDIDALCIKDVDRDDYYDPVGGDIVWFSLTAASPSLAPNSPADVFAAPYTGTPVVTAANLGLNFDDELNALKCYATTGADIKVLTFQSVPEGPFTFDVSTYNVINLFEDKHNNGPLDAWVDVDWYMDLIEDRDGDGIPDINVRWHALPGDLCTYQGMPVACGEGDGPGTGGSGDGFPSLTGDNCQDGIDNDGDNTCDVNGCPAFPNSPDPDCGDVDDIHFQIFLPASVADVVERELKLHCKPRSDTEPYTISLYNVEWPTEVEDPEPGNNFAQLDIEVTCQVADPHYKCYDIFDPTSVAELVTIEDQFNPVPVTDVLVDMPNELCPPAIKYVDGLYEGGGFAAPHLKAYDIGGMPDPDATVNITTQFGTETDVVVGTPARLLVPALKAIDPDLPTGELPLEPHYVCYWVPGDTPPPGLIIDLETQFGTEPDVQFDATSAGWLCAPAKKNGEGDLTAPHLRCYRITGGTAPGHIVNLQTQFSPPLELDVDVNQPAYMCVPAVKEHVADEADVKILSQTIYDDDCMSPPPGDIDVSVDEDICVRKVIHNNGPFAEMVLVDIDKTATAPPGCTILPPSHTDQVPVEFSIDVVHDEIFTIHCDEPSTHGPFTIDNLISIKDPVVTDPDPTNNDALSTLTVEVWADADVKITSHQIRDADCVSPPPTSIPVSEDVTVCVRKELHNNGPLDPVNVDIFKIASASGGATILPSTGTDQVLLPFSVIVTHDEFFTIHCYDPGFPTSFTVDNNVTMKDEHVRGGVFASDTIWVDCTEELEADSKVVGAGVYDYLIADRDTTDPDLDIWDTDNVVIELISEEHNNGPNEALSRFTFLADVPLGCGGEWVNEFDTYRPFDPTFPIDQLTGFGPTPGIKDPGDGNPNTAESVTWSPLTVEPVSIIIPWVEQFDLHCLTEGTYSFYFCNKQEVEPPAVDPDLFNSFMCFTMDVTSVDCTSGVDTDGDTFNDDIECYLPTDQADPCPDVIGADDAWPLDVNMDTFVTVVGDVLAYSGLIGQTVPPAPKRLDLNMDGFITVVGDVLAFSGKVGSSC
jgi:hypothetical protein